MLAGASNRPLFSLTHVAALASPAVFAAQAKVPAAPGQGGCWKAADVNADMVGFITQSEYRNYAQAHK